MTVMDRIESATKNAGPFQARRLFGAVGTALVAVSGVNRCPKKPGGLEFGPRMVNMNFSLTV